MRTTLQNDTAILFFANSAEEDFARKKFDYRAVSLFQDLTQHTLKTIESTGLPFFHFTEKEQLGNTFGERFAHAFASLFALGYTKVISVGNDSPNLTAQHILKAQEQVSKGNAVIGPSLDGGCYLMGFHRDSFQKESFKALPWQSPTLHQELLLQLDMQGMELTLLGILNDIDSMRDVKRLSNYIKTVSAYWIGLFGTLFNFGNPKELAPIPIFETHSFSTPFNKGSPFRD
ncbi:MAG: DUF2064 domain-containing protein [Bacteroidota bacterium]|nr:DUF2064 domain-containing protein [uncultured Allomuricauda sp.]